VTIWIAILCGGVGGSVRGVLALYRGTLGWLQLRRQLHQSQPHGPRQRFASAADWNAELIGMAAQVLIGALVGALLTKTGTVTGIPGAMLAGVSAPAILTQLSQVKLAPAAVAAESAPEPSSTPVITIVGGTSVDGPEAEGAAHGG
jgi:hypothetical protein